jgi:hypothetical protein
MKGQRNSENLYEVVECFEMRCLEAAEGNREETRPSLVCHPDFSHRELFKEKTKLLQKLQILLTYGSSKATSNTDFRQSREPFGGFLCQQDKRLCKGHWDYW